MFKLQSQELPTAPHNGFIKQVGYYYLEVVDCYGYLEVYLYDLSKRPVRNYGLQGWVDFHHADSTCSTAALYPYGIDGFTAANEQSYLRADIVVRGRGVSVQSTVQAVVCRRPDVEE